MKKFSNNMESRFYMTSIEYFHFEFIIVSGNENQSQNK